MNFQELVESVVSGETGIVCVGVSAYDGLMIEKWVEEGFNVDVSELAAELSFVLKEIKRISADLGFESIGEISFGGNHGFVHVNMVGEEYFLFVVTKEGKLTGKTRFYLKYASRLLREIL